MSALVWDESGTRKFETGVKKAVLYPQSSDGSYPKGIAWNGITEVDESPSGAEAQDFWADDIKYATMRSAEDYAGTIKAYMSPEEFDVCDGTAEIATGVFIGQQQRTPFGLCYVTTLGNDTESTNHGYKINIVYNATASPSSKTHSTINDNPDAVELSWDFETTPINVTGHKATAKVVIDSTLVDATKLAAFETILYGSTDAEARLPLPDELITLFAD